MDKEHGEAKQSVHMQNDASRFGTSARKRRAIRTAGTNQKLIRRVQKQLDEFAL